jgi:hypothetical protein
MTIEPPVETKIHRKLINIFAEHFDFNSYNSAGGAREAIEEIESFFSTQQAQMREKVLEYKRRNILRMNSSEIALIDDLLTILGEE